jgi:hypothetical protein
MRQETCIPTVWAWQPTVGEWISVPDPLTHKRKAMRVTKRVKKDGKRYVQCGNHLFPVDVCQKWEPVRVQKDGYAIVYDPNLWQFLNDLCDRGVKHG